MAVTDTAVSVLSDRVEVYLGIVDEDGRTARHDLHVFGDADLLEALGNDLANAAASLRAGETSAPVEAPVAEKPAKKGA